MAFNDTHRVEEAEFEGDTSSLTGDAVYDYTVDGDKVTDVSLSHVDMDGAKLSRDWMVTMVSNAVIERIEDWTWEDLQDLHDDGELNAI